MRICLLMLSLLFVTQVARCEDNTLKLGLTMIRGVMEPRSNDTPYNALLDYLSAESGVVFDRGFYPSGRSNYLLEHHKIDCIFPIAEGAYRRGIETIYSQPVNRVSTHLFTVTPSPLKSLDDVVDKTVVYQRGYLFGNLVTSSPVKVNFVPVINQQAAIDLLKKDRAAAYMEYLPDLRFSLTEHVFNTLYYDANAPIQSSFDVFECNASEPVSEALSKINAVIEQATESGELKRLLSSYYNLD